MHHIMLIVLQVLGYDEEGRVLNYVGVSAPTPADITAAASRVLTFIDMGGHEKYLKTTLYGMTCTLPGDQ
jgi:GTPase